MRILFFSDHFPPEGNAPASRLWEHATRWAAAGHRVTVVTSFPNWPEGRIHAGYRNAWRQVEVIEGIRVVRVWTFITCGDGFGLRSLDYLSYMVTSILAALREPLPDVVVGTSPPFFAAVAAWFTGALRGRPFVFELRDLWPASILPADIGVPGTLRRVLEAVELFLYRKARAVVAVTESFRDDLVRRGIPAGKIHVIRNGVDPNRYSPRPRDRAVAERLGLQDTFVVAYLGTFGVAQGLGTVVDAAERLRDRPGIVFLLAGSGPEWPRLRRRVDAARLDNVRFLDRQPKERMPELWSCCDVCVVPLRDEPVFASVIPSKIFEAMGMGVPLLLSTPEGEATGIVRALNCGRVVPPADPAALADAIHRLAGMPTERAEMAANARAAAEGFSRERTAVAMLAVLEAVVRGG